MQQFKTLLGRIATGERWQRETSQARFIHSALKDCLPPELAPACEAWLGDKETLTIACPNGMYASKLKQITPRLIHQLQAVGVEVRAIRVEVQASRASQIVTKDKVKLSSPPEQVITEIEQLGSEISAEPLSRALKNLAHTLRQR